MEHIGGGTYRQSFDPDGPQADCWVYEDLVYINKRHVAAVGFDRDDMTMSPITYDEMRPGCYEPKARIADKEANWVEASLCFPTFPRFCGQTFLEAKDKELAEACVVAYNDFMVEEWCGDSGGQAAPALHHPACGTPRRPPPRCAATLPAASAPSASARSRPTSACPASTAATGTRSSPPARRPAPWSACTSARRPKCRPPRPTRRSPSRRRSASATPCRHCPTSSSPACSSASPTLVLAYSEGQIGWLPYILERADDVWREHRAWGGVKDIVLEPPSTYFHRQVYGCFFRDQHGLDSLDVIGADRITFETDYPHTDSTWPDTRAVAEQMVRHLADEDVYRIMRGNAIAMLGLDIT